jgi:hypothetical protein
MLARAFDLIKKQGIVGVVSFSDPLLRRTASGDVLHMGHVGTIYQAHNGIYLGRGTARTLSLLPDGRVFSDRAAQKIRNSERGWKYAAAQLEAFGATSVPTDASERTEWLNTSLQSLATRVRHKGNHKYAWPLSLAIRRQLPVSLPYPKSLDRAA